MNSVNKALNIATAKLNDNSTSASLDVEVLLSHILNKNRSWLLTHPDFRISLWQNIKYNNLIKKRINNHPIAYLIGYKEFYGLKFKVNKHTLVPRPESELFIDELKKINPHKKTIVDIGTGSGCIIISAAKNLPDNLFLGIDISKKALRVARQNAQHHNIKLRLIQNNLLESLDIKIDIIMANLPYLTQKQMQEPSIQREPIQALASGVDGLNHYRQLIEQIKNLEHKPDHILLEIDPIQSTTLEKIIKDRLPHYKINIIPDLNKQNRIIHLS